METKPDPRGFDGRVWRNICFNANRLAARNPVPGMGVDDYRQDLALDLVRRSAWFNPDRASFPTFADRVITHRVATLIQPTAKRDDERSVVSLDAVKLDEAGTYLVPEIPDGAPPIDDVAIARVDVGRFVDSLSPALRRCCAMLQGDGIAKEAKAAGIHRSTLHEHVLRLRAAAISAGLDVYIERMPDGSGTVPVGDGKNAAGNVGHAPEPAMTKDVPLSLGGTLRDINTWFRSAKPGETLEYHRGYLAMDRGVGSRLGEEAGRELDRVATALIAMAQAGDVHLVQRRHGLDDYTYIAVRARSRRRSVRPVWGAGS